MTRDEQLEVLREYITEVSGGLVPTDEDLEVFLWEGNHDPVGHLQQFRSVDADRLLVELGRRAGRRDTVGALFWAILGRAPADVGRAYYERRLAEGWPLSQFVKTLERDAQHDAG